MPHGHKNTGLGLIMNYRNICIRVLSFLLLFFAAAHTAYPQKGKKKQFTVVIDPGHGGVDPGALGRKAKEKDVNMSVSRLLADMIKDEYPEVKVIFTRTTDVKIPLVKRANIANDANADLFISIHSNANKSRAAHGCETFTLGAGSSAEAKKAAMYENEVILSEDNFEELYKGFDPRSSESYIIFELIRSHDMELSAELAQMVQKGMVKRSNLHNRGVSSAGFLVLHRTVMPSILVELGFITNSNDESLLAAKDGQKKLAKGIFDGFAEFYRIYGKGEKKATATKRAEAEPIPAENVLNETANETAEKSGNEEKKAETKPAKSSGLPVFKVQILVSDSKLKKGDSKLKGLSANYYVEKGMYKYTYGESEDYNKIVKTRQEVAKKFKDAFIVAFIDGKKVNTQEAIRIFKESR